MLRMAQADQEGSREITARDEAEITATGYEAERRPAYCAGITEEVAESRPVDSAEEGQAGRVWC